MDLDSLRCFDAVATTLNFRAASKRVHLSPTALSDRIRRLEEDLGVRLFERTTRTVRVTDAGHSLLPMAREILDASKRLMAAASGSEIHAPPYELFIGTRYELGLSWLCPSLTRLRRSTPERTLHLYFGDSPDLMARLDRGDVDAVVASVRLTRPKLQYAALHPEEYVFVGRPGTKIRSAADAENLTLVDASSDLPLFRYFLDAVDDSAPWPFRAIEYMGGIGAIRLRVLEGERVAVLPRYFVAKDLKDRRLVPLMRKTKLRSDAFRLIWRAGHPRAAELLSLAEQLRTIPLK